MITPLLVLALQLLQEPALPLRLADADPPAARRQDDLPGAATPRAPGQPQDASGLLRRDEGGLVDLDWFELQPRIGIAFFTEDWRIDPSPVISVLAHAPLPWLSPASDPGGDYFGVFVDLGILPNIERTLDPAPSDNSGPAFLIGLGLDYTVLRNQAMYFVLRAGAQYGYFSGIEGLSNGFAPLAGFDLGVYLGSGLTLTAAPAGVFGRGGDSIYMASLGLVIEF